MTASTTYVSGAILTAGNMNSLPWGLVDATAGGTSGRGYVNSSTNFTMTTTLADVTNMTVTWTAVTGRLYRGSFNGMGDNVGTAQFWIVEIANGSNVQQVQRQEYMQSSLPTSMGIERIWTGLSGSQTMKVRARVNTANNAIINGSSFFTFYVEDIGPST